VNTTAAGLDHRAATRWQELRSQRRSAPTAGKGTPTATVSAGELTSTLPVFCWVRIELQTSSTIVSSVTVNAVGLRLGDHPAYAHFACTIANPQAVGGVWVCDMMRPLFCRSPLLRRRSAHLFFQSSETSQGWRPRLFASPAEAAKHLAARSTPVCPPCSSDTSEPTAAAVCNSDPQNHRITE